MARIIPKFRKGEEEPYAYNIRVFRGKDAAGKELSPYSMTWRVPEGLKTEESIKRALNKVVWQFETDCLRGTVSIENRTVSEYARYFIDICNAKLWKNDNEKSLLTMTTQESEESAVRSAFDIIRYCKSVKNCQDCIFVKATSYRKHLTDALLMMVEKNQRTGNHHFLIYLIVYKIIRNSNNGRAENAGQKYKRWHDVQAFMFCL